MNAQMNRFTPRVVAKVLGLGVAFTGLFLLLMAMVWLSGYGQPQAAYADPFGPPEGYPKLSLSVKAVEPTLALTDGVTLTYTIEMRNTGAYTATGTTLTDVIPEGTSYNGDAWASAAPPPTYTNGVLTWQGEVGFDDTVVLTFSVTASPTLSGALHNTAVLSHPWIAEPVVVMAPTVLTDRPILAIEKTAVPLKPGANKPLTYTLVVVNEGQPATNLPLTVTDRVPLGTTLLHVGSGGMTNPARDVVTWTRDITLDTGEEVSFTFTVEVSNVISGTVITNDDYRVRSPETGQFGIQAAGADCEITKSRGARVQPLCRGHAAGEDGLFARMLESHGLQPVSHLRRGRYRVVGDEQVGYARNRHEELPCLRQHLRAVVQHPVHIQQYCGGYGIFSGHGTDGTGIKEKGLDFTSKPLFLLCWNKGVWTSFCSTPPHSHTFLWPIQGPSLVISPGYPATFGRPSIIRTRDQRLASCETAAGMAVRPRCQNFLYGPCLQHGQAGGHRCVKSEICRATSYSLFFLDSRRKKNYALGAPLLCKTVLPPLKD